jgi:hypothetical protein
MTADARLTRPSVAAPDFDSHALNCPKPVSALVMREAKFVEYNESPDAPQSNRRIAARRHKETSFH